MFEIVYVSYGLACFVDDKVYMNEKLKLFPRLHKLVVDHELQHAYGNDQVDFKQPWDNELFKFILLNPDSWVHYFPLWKYEDKLTFDKFLLKIWAFVISWLLIVFFVSKWILS